MNELKQRRKWMKADFDLWGEVKSDQVQKLPQPSLEKPYDKNLQVIDLPTVDSKVLIKTNIFDIIRDRSSQRKYTQQVISIEELSFLLWATQGVKEVRGEGYATMRTVPSGGARHPFETYLAVNQVNGLKEGIYRYLALTHQLVLLKEVEALPAALTEAANGQRFVGNGPVTFIWSCIPYRGEWRYHISAHKTMVLDAGHLCQNLYIAAEAIGCGTCGIGSYNQNLMDQLLEIDGEDEFVVYMAPVGKI